MKDNVKVSVIIPVYNAEKYLRECLDSVVNQTLKDIEILCVDDGSTDNSYTILKEYAHSDNRIKVFVQENQGAGPARNLALETAIGKYISFMDSDDYYANQEALYALFKAAEEHAALISGGGLLFLKEGSISKASLNGEDYFFCEDGWMNYSDLQQDYYYQRYLYNRQFLCDNSIKFPNYRCYEDPPFFVKAMILAGKFYAIQDDVYVYRQGSTRSWTSEKICDLMNGVVDVLELTAKGKLGHLHYITASRILNSNYMHKIMQSVTYEKPKAMSDVCKKFYKALDFSLLAENRNNLNRNFLMQFITKNTDIPVYTKLNRAYSDSSVKPKVSVIIPVYNVELYLRDCLDSIVNQTFSDIEIICVNDGSTDNGLNILEEYYAKDDRITLVSQKNGGLSVARNVGLQHACGEYVIFIDSDDMLKQIAIERLWQVSKDSNLDVLFFDADVLYETDELHQKLIAQETYFHRKEVIANVMDGAELFSKLVHNKDYNVSACIQFIKREHIQNNKIYFYEGIIHEDNLFTFKNILQAKRTAVINEAFYIRRVRGDSIVSAKPGFVNMYGLLKCFTGMLDFIADKNFEMYVQDSIKILVDDTRNLLCSLYSNLDESEKDRLNGLNLAERIWLQMVIASQGKYSKVDNLSETVTEKDRKINSLSNANNALKNSASFKIGRTITFIPRKIRGGIKCLKEHGIGYTIKRLLWHLGIKG